MGKIHQKFLSRLVLALFITFTTLAVIAGPGGVDTAFNVIPTSWVYSTLVGADGKIFLGGSFSTVGAVSRNGLARLYPDGTLDTTFSNSIAGGTSVYALLRQPDGKLLVGGSFFTLGSAGPSRQNIARLNVDGSVDGTFTNSAPNSSVYALALQSDGRILIGGQFYTVGGSNHYYIARLNTDGTVDNSFNAGNISGAAVYAIAVQADGNILIGGSFGSFTTYGLSRNNIARLLTNGTPDISYQPSATAPVQAVYLQGDGRSLWAGAFTSLNNFSRYHVGRLNTDGSLDNSFTTPSGGANNTVYALTEDANNNIYVGGVFSAYNNAIHEGVARLYSDGTVDSTFNNTTNFAVPQVRALAIQPDGKVLAGGEFFTFNSYGRTNLVRLYGDAYPPEFVNQPRSTNVAVGTTVTFSADVSNPTTVYYQWYFNGTSIPGATYNQYSVFNAQFDDAGAYSVDVSDGLGATGSSNAVLQVGIVPSITQQPTNLTVNQGDTATFTAAASGAPLNYFWKYNGKVVGTNVSLTLTNVLTGQAGGYSLTVSNFLGSTNSQQAVLTVLYPVNIVASPTNQAVTVGSPVTLNVTATGNPLNYQWFQNSNAILGANASAYALTNAILSDAGSYFVVVSNQFNSMTSSVASLAVGIPPQHVQFRLNASHQPEIQMPGTSGFNYVLQVSTNLTRPVVWQNIATNSADTNGVWSVADTNTPASGGRYYRVSLF